jgi:hypothetical protein
VPRIEAHCVMPRARRSGDLRRVTIHLIGGGESGRHLVAIVRR